MRSSVSRPSMPSSQTSSRTRSTGCCSSRARHALRRKQRRWPDSPRRKERRGQRLADTRFVVHNENGMRHRSRCFYPARGRKGSCPVTSVTGKLQDEPRAPIGELSSTSNRAVTCSAMIRLAMAKAETCAAVLWSRSAWKEKAYPYPRGEIPWPLSATTISTVSRSGGVETCSQHEFLYRRAFHGLCRVIDQVDDHAAQQFFIRANGRQIGAQNPSGRGIPSSLPPKTASASLTIGIGIRRRESSRWGSAANCRNFAHQGFERGNFPFDETRSALADQERTSSGGFRPRRIRPVTIEIPGQPLRGKLDRS